MADGDSVVLADLDAAGRIGRCDGHACGVCHRGRRSGECARAGIEGQTCRQSGCRVSVRSGTAACREGRAGIGGSHGTGRQRRVRRRRHRDVDSRAAEWDLLGCGSGVEGIVREGHIARQGAAGGCWGEVDGDRAACAFVQSESRGRAAVGLIAGGAVVPGEIGWYAGVVATGKVEGQRRVAVVGNGCRKRTIDCIGCAFLGDGGVGDRGRRGQRDLLHGAISSVRNEDISVRIDCYTEGHRESTAQCHHSRDGGDLAADCHNLLHGVIVQVRNENVAAGIHRHVGGLVEAASDRVHGRTGRNQAVDGDNLLHRVIALIPDKDIAAPIHRHAPRLAESVAHRDYRRAGGDLAA